MMTVFTQAFKDTLASRHETFLAYYSRNLKMFLAVVFLLIVASPVYITAYIEKMKLIEDGQEELLARSADKSATDKSAALQPLSEAELKALANADTSRVSEKELEAIKTNDRDFNTITPLEAAPDPNLVEVTSRGLLPKIGENGQTPWQTYARPFNALDRRPRIAIVVGGLGLSRGVTEKSISELPGRITLAFDAQSDVTGSWLVRARQNGHETLLDLPMEPFDYPRNDPGPDTLLTHIANSKNLQRLLRALRAGSGYVGVTTLSGSRFTADPEKLFPVLQNIRARGLLVLDAKLSPHSTLRELCKQNFIPVTRSSFHIDTSMSEQEIKASFQRLEQAAQLTGRAIGIIKPSPRTLLELQKWIKTLPERGIALAPLSSTVEQ